jgi:indolepyruvate ferredoxin oxidoreductase, alpha subunit
MNTTDLLNRSAFSSIAMGNHALARAMVETGTQVITTYPGSPTPEIAALLGQVPEGERPYYFEYSINEKVALEVAAGASMNGRLSAVFFKSVGLNVASDSMIQLPMLELIGGMVILLGDDPGANSSQNEQDNRHFARMAHMPMLEPATPQEAYAMYLEAARLSREMSAPVCLRTTTHVAHAREVVRFGPLAEEAPGWTSRFDLANGPYWPIADQVFALKKRALEKRDRFEKTAEESPFNPVISSSPEGPRQRGVIASGLAALAVVENIFDQSSQIDVLKIGFTYPLPRGIITAFLRRHESVLVVEELDRVMEHEIKAMAFDAGVSCEILSRRDLEEEMGEITADRARRLLKAAWPAAFPGGGRPRPDAIAVPRAPQLCPGCGHRSAFFAIGEALRDEDITVGDIGCHTLGALPPHNLGQLVLSMGHSVSTGAGLALRTEGRRVVAFIGDSTLFHAGLPGVINAAMNDHDLTLVVLENSTTAMTGHQPRPGTGEVGSAIDLRHLLETLGVGFVRVVDAYNQKGVRESLEEAMNYRGFAVVVAAHPCVLKLTRERKKKRPGLEIPKIVVDQDACTKCGTCVGEFGCPSFELGDEGKVTVAPDVCIGDGSCIQTCDAGALKREARR